MMSEPADVARSEREWRIIRAFTLRLLDGDVFVAVDIILHIVALLVPDSMALWSPALYRLMMVVVVGLGVDLVSGVASALLLSLVG